MRVPLIIVRLVVISLTCQSGSCFAADSLTVESDFEGASVRVLEIDQDARGISFMPGGDPERGWPCWWYFRIDGITPGETITLRIQGSIAAIASQKPLAASWAMPAQAMYSSDGEIWRHTDKGTREDEWMIYTLAPEAESVYVAWGPPYTPTAAETFVRAMGTASPHASAEELCRSRGDRSVPMLRVREGNRDNAARFGVWVQARQHAWESGSSWVAHGFAEWLLSDDERAAWLRQHAEVFVVPIMDIDNTATGNGGKNALPHDHNRDWSGEPHWNEVIAAQRRIRTLIDEDRMDVFLDLHNPAPGDPTFFFMPPKDTMPETALGRYDRFIELACARISRITPPIPMTDQPRVTGANYHPLWKQISSNWVSMNGNSHTVSLCLETTWNHENSTATGYRAVGANLSTAVQQFLAGRSASTATRDQ